MSHATATPSHPNFLAEFGSHAVQFLEPLGDPPHDLLFRRSLTGGQKAIPARQLLLVGPFDFFDCGKSLH